MKKEIVLKDALRAYEHYTTAKGSLEFDKKYAPDRGARAQQVFDQASEDLKQVLSPIEEAIEEAQKRARVRTIDATDIITACRRIEAELQISRKAMEGIEAIVDVNAQTFPGAYKGTPESTHFDVRFKNGAWRISHIYRTTTNCKTNAYQLKLTDAAKKAIIERMTTFC